MKVLVAAILLGSISSGCGLWKSGKKNQSQDVPTKKMECNDFVYPQDDLNDEERVAHFLSLNLEKIKKHDASKAKEIWICLSKKEEL